MSYHIEWRLVEYTRPDGGSPFAEWFSRLDAVTAARLTLALVRLSQGNASHVKALGQGLHELKADFGPGYRVYFVREFGAILLLLGAGTKRHQARDIATARQRLKEHRSRQSGE